jgi:cytochrome b involved in lipid metabolism
MELKQLSPEEDGAKGRGIFGSPEGWLREKAEIDQRVWGHAPANWVVDNVEYDLSAFMDKHPGGRHWLALTRGQNVSEHFHVHHLNLEHAQSVLAEYRVRPTPRQAYRFSFRPDGLYETIRRELLKRHSPRELQDNSPSQAVAAVFVLCLLASLLLTGYC